MNALIVQKGIICLFQVHNHWHLVACVMWASFPMSQHLLHVLCVMRTLLWVGREAQNVFLVLLVKAVLKEVMFVLILQQIHQLAVAFIFPLLLQQKVHVCGN